MAPKKGKHPERLKVQAKPADPLEKQKQFVTDIRSDVQAAEADRETWQENQTRWYKKRYGVRPATKNFPFPGASNTHIALTDEKIRKLKPNFINLAFEADPIVNMFAVGQTPPEAAADSEVFMDWLLKYYMDRVPGKNYVESLALTIDKMLEKGFCPVKVVWEYHYRTFKKVIDIEDLPSDQQLFISDPETTDDALGGLLAQEADLDMEIDSDRKQVEKAIKRFRSGEKLFSLNLREVMYSGPRVSTVDPKDLIVPSDTTDTETARFICHRMWMTLNTLKAAERDGKFKNVDNISEANTTAHKKPDTSTIASTKDQKEGVHEVPRASKLIEVWELFTYYDMDGDGVEEKVVITYQPDTDTILRFIAYPYDHGKWPFVVFRYELTDERWHSPRGIPELLDHYQTIATNQENAKLDRMTMANALQFKYRIGSVNPSQMRFIPGQGVPVQRMDDLQELKIQNLDISFDQEMQKVRGLSEALIGQPDFNAGALDRPQERRTAFEVSEVVSLGKQIFSMDARLFKSSLQKMYNQIFDLWFQYGPEEVWVQVTGGDPVQITRKQLSGDFMLVPNGEFSILSRTLEIQRAAFTLQQGLSDQSGAVDHYELWRNWFLKVDPRLSKRALRTREEYDQIQQRQQAAQDLEFQKKLQIAGRTPTVGNGTATGAGLGTVLA